MERNSRLLESCRGSISRREVQIATQRVPGRLFALSIFVCCDSDSDTVSLLGDIVLKSFEASVTQYEATSPFIRDLGYVLFNIAEFLRDIARYSSAEPFYRRYTFPPFLS
jgi:hypothetical protein